MNLFLIQRLRGLFSNDDDFYRFLDEFGNERIPGKKFRWTLLREKFYQDFQPGKSIARFAERYHLSVQALYGWLKRPDCPARLKSDAFNVP